MAVTIRDVAREAGVSISTVSRALASPDQVAEPTRMQVRRTAERMGYRPNRNARSLITGRSGTIGMVVPDLENPFFGSVCKGVQARARAAGYSVFVADTDEDPTVENGIIRDLLRQVDGAILCSPRAPDEEILGLAGEKPLILANRRLTGIPSVTFDNVAGMKSVLDHLVALGHRRIAYAAGPERSFANHERAQEFERYFRESKDLEAVRLGSFPPYFSGGVQAADLAVASGASAVVAYNDILGLGLLDRLHERGCRVPDDISVAGFDNVAVSTFVWPTLTTVSLPRIQMGSVSVDWVLDLVTGLEADDSTARQIPVELIVRQSTAVPGTGEPGHRPRIRDGRSKLLNADAT